jgi:hypothetical protein
VFTEKTADIAGKIIAKAVSHPFITAGIIGGGFVVPAVIDKFYKFYMLREQGKINKELRGHENLLQRIAENTTKNNINSRKMVVPILT